MTEHLCGCCGNEIVGAIDDRADWCGRCEPHIGPDDYQPVRLPAWARTHLVQTGEDCPYRIPREVNP